MGNGRGGDSSVPLSMIQRNSSVSGASSRRAALALAVVTLVGCERKRTQRQGTPDDVVKSAVAMVKNNDAKQLSNLFYAGSPEERVLMDKLWGAVRAPAATFRAAAGKRWPEEYAKLQEEAMKSASEKSPGLLMMLAQGGGRGGGGAGSKPPNPDQRGRCSMRCSRIRMGGWIGTRRG